MHGYPWVIRGGESRAANLNWGGYACVSAEREGMQPRLGGRSGERLHVVEYACRERGAGGDECVGERGEGARGV